MYRTQETSKSPPNGLEQDDNYEFSGATLKISGGGDDNQPPPPLQKATENNQSAILSGSDVPSPIHSGNVPSGSGLNTTTTSKSTTLIKPKIGSPAHFFSFRSGQFERAVTDCVNVLLRPANDTEVVGSWLLTDVSHWDHERERVYILTTKVLLEVKYDFIALRILQHHKVRLSQVDTILRGNIIYPQSSLVPERNDCGIRIMWNKGQPISILTSWNPFATEIPWKTIKNHPVFGYQDLHNSPNIQESLEKHRQIYSVEDMYEQLVKVFAESSDLCSKFEEGPILMANYVGIGAVIHNKHNFGFFKVRGKFSF